MFMASSLGPVIFLTLGIWRLHMFAYRERYSQVRCWLRLTHTVRHHESVWQLPVVFSFTERVERVLLCAFRSGLPVVSSVCRPVFAWDQGEVSVSHHKRIPQTQLQRRGQKEGIANTSSVSAGWGVSLHGLIDRLLSHLLSASL